MTRYARAKLTPDQVLEIREWYSPGQVSYAMLAAHYGVTKATIACIVTGRTWKDLASDGTIRKADN
jgi:plasmid maintenance system antidote protein VapI